MCCAHFKHRRVIEAVNSKNKQNSLFYPEDGDSIFLRNADRLLPHYTALRDRLCGLVVRIPGCRSSRRYQIFWEVVGLERGPLSLVSTIEELLGRNSSGSGLENREYGRGDPLHWPRDTLYPQKLALTSPTYGGRSVGIVRSRTKATEFVLLIWRYVPEDETLKARRCELRSTLFVDARSVSKCEVRWFVNISWKRYRGIAQSV
jgi:hypothetical protein